MGISCCRVHRFYREIATACGLAMTAVFADCSFCSDRAVIQPGRRFLTPPYNGRFYAKKLHRPVAGLWRGESFLDKGTLLEYTIYEKWCYRQTVRPFVVTMK